MLYLLRFAMAALFAVYSYGVNLWGHLDMPCTQWGGEYRCAMVKVLFNRLVRLPNQ